MKHNDGKCLVKVALVIKHSTEYCHCYNRRIVPGYPILDTMKHVHSTQVYHTAISGLT